MKLNARRVIAFFLLIALSAGFGFAFDAVATAVEKSKYPRPEAIFEKVQAACATYGLPEAVVFATMRSGSDFASNALSEDGRIGLMQLTPERFNTIRTELQGLPPAEAGLLYDPDTNLTGGCAYLTHLYEHYGVWELVYAAYYTGAETVDAWLTDPSLIDENGVLHTLPDGKTAAYVKQMERAVEYYTKLYYES